MFKISMTRELYNMAQTWATQITTECSWMGRVTYDQSTTTFTVHEWVIPEQRCHPTTTEMDKTSLAKLEHELMVSGNEGSLSYWNHTHPGMGIGPSGQDETQIREFAKHGWHLASIWTGKDVGHYLMTVSEVMGKTEEYFLNNQKIELVISDEVSNADKWVADMKAKILGPPQGNYIGKNYGYPSYKSGGMNLTSSVKYSPPYNFNDIRCVNDLTKQPGGKVLVPEFQDGNLYAAEMTVDPKSKEGKQRIKQWQQAYNERKRYLQDLNIAGAAAEYLEKHGGTCITELTDYEIESLCDASGQTGLFESRYNMDHGGPWYY